MGLKGAKLTQSSQAFHDEIMTRLEALGRITSRKMFGGFGIYHEGVMFGLISGTTMYCKVDESLLPDFEVAGSHRHDPMPYYSVPEEVLSDLDTFHTWAGRAVAISKASAPMKVRSRKSTR